MSWFFLVGFMGVGKTTLGTEVAKRLSLPFFDLDERVAIDAGGTIPEIFESEGETGFRKRETRALRNLLERETGGVVATGGGAYTMEENRTMMRTAGVAVWLDVPTDEVIMRVSGENRPLWASEAEARALAERRKEYYRLANLHLELSEHSTEDGVTRLYELLAPLMRNDS